jgi:NAD(P)-dependent dehydrogenase (short-subunit alcohol dehydrogenase family)
VGRLAGKHIIVTGGTQGIGEATVRAYAAQGATVYSLDVKAERGELVAREATDAGSGTVTFLLADVSDRTAVDAAFGEANNAMGGLDVRSTSRASNASPTSTISVRTCSSSSSGSTCSGPCTPTASPTA